MDYTVHGILQARILEWVAFSPGDLPNPGIEPRSPALQANSLLAEPQGKPSVFMEHPKWHVRLISSTHTYGPLFHWTKHKFKGKIIEKSEDGGHRAQDQAQGSSEPGPLKWEGRGQDTHFKRMTLKK